MINLHVLLPPWRCAPLPLPSRPICCCSSGLLEPSPGNSRSPIDPISATRPLRRTQAPPSTPNRARVPPRRRIW